MSLTLSLRRLALLSLAALAAFGCDEDPEQPLVEPLPEVPAPEYSAGHLAQAQRGVTIDIDDLSVIAPGNDRVGVSPATLADEFGLLVLTRPYVEWRATRCPRSNEAADSLPAATTRENLERLADAGVDFDRLAINVPMLAPGRRALLYVCFDEGAREPRFDVPEHRREIIEAYEALARLGGVNYITVGLEMNLYYHLLNEDGERTIDDYSNWVTLYREIYTAIKAVDDSIQVGPGVSWSVFMRQTVPEIADELAIADPTSLEAVHAAYTRTILPLLRNSRATGGGSSADYIGITLVPIDAEDPFRGEPRSDDPDRQAEILDYYRYAPLFQGPQSVPIVLPMIDWAEQGGAAGAKKGPFMATVKEAFSWLPVEWAAWRRLSTLPDDPPEANPCKKYIENTDAALRYPASYCNAGMLDESGTRRSVWEEFLAE